MRIPPYQKPFRGSQLNRSHPLVRDLIGAFILNEGTGNRVQCHGNPRHDGTIQNNLAWVVNAPGIGLYNAARTNDNRVLLDNPIILPDGPWTAIWSVEQVAGASEVIFGKNVVGSSGYIAWGTDYLYHRNDNGDGIQIGATLDRTGLNQWSYRVMESGAGAEVDVFKNGAMYVENESGPINDPLITVDFLMDGATNSNINMIGTMFYIYFFDKALSDEEIFWLYREPYSIFQPRKVVALFSVLEGSICWGHVTGVTQDNVETFANKWSGTGEASGSGNNEIITLDSGENMESEVINIGDNKVEILIDEYQTGSGPAPVIKYKDGNSVSNCNADSWNIYSVPFDSTGFVKIRIEAS